MKILLTGGAGFIGSHLADAFLAAGHECVVVDDLSSGRRENVPKEAEFHELDLRDGEAVETLFARFKPDVVSHQGAQTSVAVSTREPLRDAEVNILGGLNVLRSARAHGVERLVFASTGGAIYGEVPEGRRADVAWLPKTDEPLRLLEAIVRAVPRRRARGIWIRVDRPALRERLRSASGSTW